MRQLVILFVRRLKRDPAYTLDAAMPNDALLGMLMNTFAKAVRGQIRRIGFKQARGVTFIGRHVMLRNKRYISVGRNFIAEDYCEILGLSRNGITFGDRVTVGRFAMIRPTRAYGGGELGEGLVVGNNSNIGAYCYIGCSGGIRIGNNVMMSPRVSLYAENHNFSDTDRPMKEQGVTRAPIVIEDDCWIASHAVVLAGVTIGRGSIVAAGSVVTDDVPPYSIVAGVPARVIRSRLAKAEATAAARAQGTGAFGASDGG
jgi:acetyltransferase-like isoleucine patch superfamily enzyme